MARSGVCCRRSSVLWGLLVTSFLSSDNAAHTHIFNSAHQTYQRKDPSEVGPWTASRLIARFQTDFPSEVVLPAIDIVLAQAAKRDKVQPLGSVGMGSGDNNLSYSSRDDLELFVMAPALQWFAPDRATSLLTEFGVCSSDTTIHSSHKQEAFEQIGRHAEEVSYESPVTCESLPLVMFNSLKRGKMGAETIASLGVAVAWSMLSLLSSLVLH
jgi:hypothetical protein